MEVHESNSQEGATKKDIIEAKNFALRAVRFSKRRQLISRIKQMFRKKSYNEDRIEKLEELIKKSKEKLEEFDKVKQDKNQLTLNQDKNNKQSKRKNKKKKNKNNYNPLNKRINNSLTYGQNNSLGGIYGGPNY